ncbi:hypothetical protein RFI_40024, partial [Reticulomyxa filosa]
YIQQTMQISAMWDHQIDLNLIYVALDYWYERDTNEIFGLLFEFGQWKIQNNNEQKYKKRMNDFLERRCCNHSINLFCMFLSERYKNRTAVERAASYTINNGLPFVNNGKKPLISKKKNAWKDILEKKEKEDKIRRN